MSKDVFITFAKENLYCNIVRYMLGVNVECGRCKYRYESGSADCKKVLLEDEYQPPKQEKWIVHRRLRTKNIEVYIGCDKDDKNNANKFIKCLTIRCNSGDLFNTSITYNKNKAFRFDFEDAVLLRDELNKDRVGKQYLWVISKVEE